MGKIIQRLLAISKLELANDDLIPVQDVSEPKTKAITIAELKKVIIDTTYPVGSKYANVSDSRNPSVIFGVGTWVAHSVGRVEVGIDPSQVEFNTAGKTGGAKTHTLTIAEMPSHVHGQVVTANTGPNGRKDFTAEGPSSTYDQGANTYPTGGGGAHNNLQPYEVVYVWKRTA